MLKRLSYLIQFLLGFLIGVGILAGGIGLVGYLFFTKIAANPPTPVFEEEVAVDLPPEETNSEATSSSSSTPQPEATESEKPTEQKPKPEPEEKPKEEEEVKGLYTGRVTWDSGLVLRSEPSLEGGQVGGVPYNAELIVLENSSDGKWQKVKVKSSGQERG
ncbi:MAG: SH3 domain-containing protein [Synechococcaceae cyanobacterium RL_1_2]|nr:SH3 domain-containing protein [Synechococcaceae cyanobacterium RL_1_2]